MDDGKTSPQNKKYFASMSLALWFLLSLVFIYLLISIKIYRKPVCVPEVVPPVMCFWQPDGELNCSKGFLLN